MRVQFLKAIHADFMTVPSDQHLFHAVFVSHLAYEALAAALYRLSYRRCSLEMLSCATVREDHTAEGYERMHALVSVHQTRRMQDVGCTPWHVLIPHRPGILLRRHAAIAA